jgi:hypothetical protein
MELSKFLISPAPMQCALLAQWRLVAVSGEALPWLTHSGRA